MASQTDTKRGRKAFPTTRRGSTTSREHRGYRQWHSTLRIAWLAMSQVAFSPSATVFVEKHESWLAMAAQLASVK